MHNKRRSVVFGIVALMVVAVVGYCIYGFREIEYDEVQTKVIYVPGMWSEGADQQKRVASLEKIFPDSVIEVRTWDSNRVRTDTLRENADAFALQLAESLSNLSEEERENTILVGHSLGGRVVIAAMVELKKRKLFVKRGIFLGAAFPDDSSLLHDALEASILPCVNISNRQDKVLAVLYERFMDDNDSCALGAYGSRFKYPSLALIDKNIRPELQALENKESVEKFKNLINKLIGSSGLDDSEKSISFFAQGLIDNIADKLKDNGDNILNDAKRILWANVNRYAVHSSSQYLAELELLFSDDKIAAELTPEMHLYRFSKSFDLWKTIADNDGWSLKRHFVTRQLAICKPNGCMVSIGKAKIIKSMYNYILLELNDSKRRLGQYIDVPQDMPITVAKISPIAGVWDVIDECENWQLQADKYGVIYRIVDDRDHIRAKGGKDKMCMSFQKVKNQLTGAMPL